MSRSKWKGPVVGGVGEENDLRNIEITPRIIGKTCKIHDGRKKVRLQVTKNMIGHKFGEFSATRADYVFKKKKKKKKK